LWYEVPYSFDNGEDMQLSYLGQKHGGLKTYCPPHPKENSRLSSSTKPIYGDDSKASYKGAVTSIQNFKKQRDDNVKFFIDAGWKTVNKIK